MRPRPRAGVEQRRVTTGPFGSDVTHRNNGVFRLRGPGRVTLLVIASDGHGWEHVSVSVADEERCPSWDEMAWVKDQFWEEEESVVQFHPRASAYVNTHPFVLHLWRKVGVEPELPPISMV